MPLPADLAPAQPRPRPAPSWSASLAGALLLLSSPGAIAQSGGEGAQPLSARLRGTILIEHPGAVIAAVALPDMRMRVIRQRPPGEPVVFCVGGPAPSGRIVFIDGNDTSHALKHRRPGGEEEVLFAAPGDPLWDDVAGECLSICPREILVAVVARGKEVEDSLVPEGRLELWRLDGTGKLPVTAKALGDTWFPDGKRIAFGALVPGKEAAPLLEKLRATDATFARKLRSRSRIPVVHVLDVESGEIRALHVGARPAVSPDGRTLLVQDFTSRWRLVDPDTGEGRAFAAPEAIPEGAIAFVDDHAVLYWGRPAGEGAAVRFSQPASLRVVDLRDGTSQVLVPRIGSVDFVSFGPGDPGEG